MEYHDFRIVSLNYTYQGDIFHKNVHTQLLEWYFEHLQFAT